MDFGAFVGRRLAVQGALLVFVSVLGAAAPEGWSVRAVPGPPSGDPPGECRYRCWVRVPDKWANPKGRKLYRESVTFSIENVAGVYEVFVNGRRIGGDGSFPPRFAEASGRPNRFKVPPGTLQMGQWNEIAVRVHSRSGPPGFLGEAPSIQGYFLECILAGGWEFARGGGVGPAGRARKEKPERAAFDRFSEASRILGEAAALMPGSRLDPEESQALFRTDEDLVIEQLLTEPQVTQPTHLSFDDRGRLWVSHYRQYPYPAGLKMVSRDKYYRAKYDHEPPAPPNHHPGRSRITIHEDTDGDGGYDLHKTFLKGLDLANAALPDHDGVWVMHTPYLLFYPDADRDDVPDGDPVVHLSGFGFEDTHSVANGLVWGPDGWIYGGQGSTVACRVRRPGLDAGDAPGLYHEGCMVWRYHPDTRVFEIFGYGGGNVFGLEFDGEGRLFSGHNGGNTRAWHYVQGGYHLKQGRTPNKFGPPSNPYAFGDLPMIPSDNPVIRFTHNTIVCEGSSLPSRMQGHFLGADPLHHYLVLAERRRSGATFATKDVGFPVASDDERFRPVYLTNAPDGSILVADFYEEFVAHGQHYQSQIDIESGRVYRVRGKDIPLLRPVDLGRADSGELIRLLDHPNKWHRQMAVRLLGARGSEAGLVRELVTWIRERKDRAALDGLWALHQAGGLDEKVAVEMLAHPYPMARAWTLRLLGDAGMLPEDLIEAVGKLAREEMHPDVWAQIACTARRLPARQALPIVGGILSRSGDLEDSYLPLLCWWAIEKHCEEGLDEVKALFAGDDIWEQAMVQREILPRLMRRFAIAGRERDLLVCAGLLRRAPGPKQRAALMRGLEEAFEGGSLPHLPDELLAAISESGAGSLILRVRQGEGLAIEEAMEIAVDPKAGREDRLLYIRAFGEIESDAPLGLLLDLARAGTTAEIRRASFVALQRFESDRIGEMLVLLLPTLSGEERTAAEALLASRAGWSHLWLEAIGAGSVPKDGIAPEALANLRRHSDPQVTKLVTSHFGDLQVAAPPTAERIAAIREIIDKAPGSPYRGRPLFKRHCSSCHVLFHDGGKVGPDLTSYQRDDLDTMLTSIVDPNAEIREGYEGVSLTTTDGRVLAGFLSDRGPRTISLRSFDGSSLSFQRDKVGAVEPLGRSLMPAGLLDGLQDQQIRDLFAYLRSAQPMLAD